MEGKTARACDGCLRKRARWYCAADDASLCQTCDTSVHSANQLASRHERVRLETASSSKFNGNNSSNIDAAPTWHQGFTRKARTPRQNNKASSMLGQIKGDEKVLNSHPFDPLVPDLGSEDGSVDKNGEQLLCRVPVFDPLAEEFCDMVTNSDGDEVAMVNEVDGYEHEGTYELDDGLHGLLPSNIDLAEFAADVESLLGGRLDEDTCCDIKGIELLDSNKEQSVDTTGFCERKIVKVKYEEEVEGATAACCFDSSLNWSFHYESPTICEGEEEKLFSEVAETATKNGEIKAEMKRKMLLSLNYESVITAWATHGSPWTTGSRPEFNPDDFMGSNSKDGHQMHGGTGGIYSQLHQGRGNIDGEREARVSRYREKRRTRLFSKKIRYEVRKLNAEKRPRMKGRFVKRTSSTFMATAFP